MLANIVCEIKDSLSKIKLGLYEELLLKTWGDEIEQSMENWNINHRSLQISSSNTFFMLNYILKKLVGICDKI